MCIRDSLEAMDVKLALSNIMAAETRLLLLANQIPAALDRIAASKIYIEDTGERYYESEILRLEGDALKASKQPGLAEKAYRCALDTAESQQARWWQLRALTSLTAHCTDDSSLKKELRKLVSDFEHLDLVAVKQAILLC